VPGFEVLKNGRVIWGLENGSTWVSIHSSGNKIRTTEELGMVKKERFRECKVYQVTRLRMTALVTYRSRNWNPPMHGYGKTPLFGQLLSAQLPNQISV
jgi:hypothetical protein